ncbi:protein of unknown function [Ectopseudomonas oleovorans]|nr:protein of unknown function [Pseudomonas oleovorans]
MVKGRALARPSERSERFEPFVIGVNLRGLLKIWFTRFKIEIVVLANALKYWLNVCRKLKCLQHICSVKNSVKSLCI